MRKITIMLLVLAINGLVLAPLYADGGYARENSKLAPIMQLIDDEDYQNAIVELETALRDSPDDADLLTLLAFSHRKSGNFKVALDYYQQALSIEPDHRGANEYLGELYLKMDRPDLAQERLKVLDEECFFGCKEYKKLKNAIEDYHAENPS